MTHLWHVALGAGMGTRKPRAAIADAGIEEARAHIQRAMGSPVGDPLPGRSAYRLVVKAASGAMIGFVGRGDLALVTFGVATRSTQGARLWKVLHQGRPEYGPSAGDVPRTPYCASRGEMGLLSDISAGNWLDDYQITIAWAWIEKIR